jgi:CopG family transcriptional regulator, nickel-responsive regulator
MCRRASRYDGTIKQENGTMSNVVRVSVSLERPLYDRLEKLVEDSHYSNRSEFVRDLIRAHLVEQEWQTDKVLLGTISLIYDHHARGLSERLTDRQHHFPGNVLATTHVHLDEHLCAEMIMVRGRGRDIKALADQLQREKGVLHAKLATGTTGRSLPRSRASHSH